VHACSVLKTKLVIFKKIRSGSEFVFVFVLFAIIAQFFWANPHSGQVPFRFYKLSSSNIKRRSDREKHPQKVTVFRAHRATYNYQKHRPRTQSALRVKVERKITSSMPIIFEAPAEIPRLRPHKQIKITSERTTVIICLHHTPPPIKYI
jgi:hypothetical protein